MGNKITITSENLVENVSKIYKYIKENNPKEEELINLFSKYDRIIIDFVDFYALSKNDTEIDYILLNLCETLDIKLIEKFKKEIQNNNLEEYLSKIDWKTKVSIYTAIYFNKKLHPELYKYLNTLEISIKKDEIDDKQKDIITEYKKQKEIAGKKLEELEKNNKIKY